jgi:hypothetical protein
MVARDNGFEAQFHFFFSTSENCICFFSLHCCSVDGCLFYRDGRTRMALTFQQIWWVWKKRKACLLPSREIRNRPPIHHLCGPSSRIRRPNQQPACTHANVVGFRLARSPRDTILLDPTRRCAIYRHVHEQAQVKRTSFSWSCLSSLLKQIGVA